MRFRLIETILTEGKNIEKTWQQYKDKLIELGYDDEEHARRGFDEIIGVDPTYRQGSGTTGDFGIWLLNQHCKCNLGYDDLMGVYYNGGNNFIDLVDIISILDEFTKKKPNLEKRDINQYKSIEELANVLKNTDYSDRQKLRDAQKKRRAVKDLDNNEDAELFFENDDWEVWIPHSIDVSRKLGLGTNWCTASTSDNSHYDYYLDTEGGDYFIYINKDDPSEKYQEHIESNQFHNSQNRPITDSKKKEIIDNLGKRFEIMRARRKAENDIIHLVYKENPSIVDIPGEQPHGVSREDMIQTVIENGWVDYMDQADNPHLDEDYLQRDRCNVIESLLLDRVDVEEYEDDNMYYYIAIGVSPFMEDTFGWDPMGAESTYFYDDDEAFDNVNSLINSFHYGDGTDYEQQSEAENRLEQIRRFVQSHKEEFQREFEISKQYLEDRLVQIYQDNNKSSIKAKTTFNNYKKLFKKQYGID